MRGTFGAFGCVGEFVPERSGPDEVRGAEHCQSARCTVTQRTSYIKGCALKARLRRPMRRIVMESRRQRLPLPAAFLLGAVVLAGFVPGASRAETPVSATFRATADSYVSAVSPTKVHGSLTTIRVDAAPRRGYVRFSVTGISGSVARAWLRLYSLKSHPTGFEVRGVADNSWQESTLTYRNSPRVSASVTALSGPFAASTWLSLDVTSLVSGNGTYSFALMDESTNWFSLATRERGQTTAPQLVIEGGTSDTTAPTAPTNLVTTGSTATSVSVAWDASADDVGVGGYGVYLDGSPVGSVAVRSFTFGGLACGRSYTIGTDAFDVAGNRSPQTSLTAATTACADVQPPSAPTNVVLSGASQTALSLAWAASSDNTGVLGYKLHLNGAHVATTTGTSYSFASLTCGSTYTLGVEAYDLAGNTSTRTSLPATTSACPGAAGTTYYVDSVTGNDAYTGTSEATPWKTLAKAGSAPLLPGNALLLRRGSRWTGSLVISRSGTAVAPIVIGAYGAGAQPIVTGANSCVVLLGILGRRS